MKTVPNLPRPMAWLHAVSAALGLVAGGCSLPQAQPDLTRYYVLTPVAPTPAPEAAPADAGDRPAVRVFLRSVSVPEYLRGRIMVVRQGQNEVRYIDDARWAEPLEPGLARVLREDLAQYPGLQVALRPTDVHDFDVVVQVRQYEGVAPSHARLVAHIEIIATGLDPKRVAQDDFSIEVPGWDGQDYARLTGRLSEAAGALASRLAALLPQRNPAATGPAFP